MVGGAVVLGGGRRWGGVERLAGGGAVWGLVGGAVVLSG